MQLFRAQQVADRRAFIRKLDQDSKNELDKLQARHLAEQKDRERKYNDELARYVAEQKKASELMREIEEEQRRKELQKENGPEPPDEGK